MKKLLLFCTLVALVAVAYFALFPNANQPQTKDLKPTEKRVYAQTVKPTAYAQTLRLNADALAEESVMITAQTTDKIETIHFKEGAYVQKGQTLVTLQQDSENAAIASARATLKEAQSQFDRIKILAEKDAISKAEYDNARAMVDVAQAALKDARAMQQERVIKAPFSGVIGVRQVSEGALLEPGTVIAQLDDISTIEAELQIAERYLAQIQTGQKVTVQSSAYPDTAFEGVISVIENRLDPLSRQFTAMADINNDKHLLKPGMLLDVAIQFSEENVIAIAEEAIIPLAKKHYVFVVKEGAAQRRAVRIGRRFDGKVEILQGVQAGETVVTQGQLTLSDGDSVVITK